MNRSQDRILATHAGSLPRPADLWSMVSAKAGGQPHDEAALQQRLDRAVADVVQEQLTSGMDVVNDGELSKTSFSAYMTERLGGLAPTEQPYISPISGRDIKEFPDYFDRIIEASTHRTPGVRRIVFSCVEPLKYVGQATAQADIAHLKAALEGKGTGVADAFLPAIAPGSIEPWLKNSYYPSTEAFLYAIADAMHEEYKAIVDAGFILQIDDPDLADGWQVHPHMDLSEYRKEAELRTDVLNHALRGIEEDRVRVHMCWGSYHGPHKHDLPLEHFVDIFLNVRAQGYSVEAANPRHNHEWKVWQDVKLPEGKVLIPGVVGHYSDFIEHPQLIADRITQYANLVGRENVIAGTDCGLGTRVGHPSIVWAKFEALAEGARLATKELWG